MKTVIVAAAILGSSILNGSNNYGTINMNEKLKESITFEKGDLSLEKSKTDFVKISFKINEVGSVEILDMNYSDELVKTKLVDKLSKMKVEEAHDINEVYNYNFTFKKL
jgi:hypothetical protein